MVKFSLVIPTRGDVNLDLALAPYKGLAHEVFVWDNSQRENLSVYARYAAIAHTSNDIVMTQDDDCVLHPDVIEELVNLSDSGFSDYGHLVCNMPESRWNDYPDSALVGWGAVFHRDLPLMAFGRYAEGRAGGDIDQLVDVALGEADFFRRTCDVVFTTLTPHTQVDLGFSHLPWAEDPARAMFKQAGHFEERQRMLEMARKVRDLD